MKKADMIKLLEDMIENTKFCKNDMEATNGRTEVTIRMEGEVIAYHTVISLLSDANFAKEMWKLFEDNK